MERFKGFAYSAAAADGYPFILPYEEPSPLGKFSEANNMQNNTSQASLLKPASKSSKLDGFVWWNDRLVPVSEYIDRANDEFWGEVAYRGVSLGLTVGAILYGIATGGISINFSSVPAAVNTFEKARFFPLMRATGEIVDMIGVKFSKGENAKKVQTISRIVGGIGTVGTVGSFVANSPNPNEIINKLPEYGETMAEPVGKVFAYAMGEDYKNIEIVPKMVKSGFRMYRTVDSAKYDEFDLAKAFFETKGSLEEMTGERFPTTSVMDNLERVHGCSPELNKFMKSISKEH